MTAQIYTKAGDYGKTDLLSKKSLSKTDLVFEVLGTLDELSGFLGFLHLSKLTDVQKIVLEIQGNLLEIGSFIAGKKMTREDAKYWQENVNRLEKIIDAYDAKNTSLTTFIVPGGCAESGYLHVARSVCRRLERIFVRYFNLHKSPEMKIIESYLNRLSDLLFVLARYVNKKRGYKDITWKPKNTQKPLK
jgi:cob(I)alamin adenosyltransferase